MAIDRTGISSLNAGAGEITYSGSEGPKSPEQQLMAQADPMLVEQYQQYVFEMEEQGMQPISFRQFIQQIMSESKMANGGRAGFKYGGGPDFMNTHKPRPMGNPPVMEEIEDAREFRIANPNIEDIADYKSYYERMKRLEQLKKLIQGVKPQPMAYGGSTNPTYSQRRKQRMAYGGVAGADGRKRYGIGSFFQGVKDKFVDDIIPNEIKDNPILSSVIAGTLLNQYGMPDIIPGDMSTKGMGQNWLGNLINQDLVFGPGGEQTGDLGFNLLDPKTYLGGGGNKGSLDKNVKDLTYGIPGEDQEDDVARMMENMTLPGQKELSPFRKALATVLPGGDPGYFDLYDTLLGPSTYGTPGNETTVNWKAPLAAGLSLGALDAATRKDETLPDQPGIDIPAIRAAALQGQGGAFLPPASATTAYANGGRTGYYAGNMVKQNVFSSFSDYKNRGGTKDFMGWYSDNYLPEMPRREEEAMPERTREEEDYTLDNWPHGFRKAIPGQDQLGIMTMADGGRIGYEMGGTHTAWGQDKAFRIWNILPDDIQSQYGSFSNFFDTDDWHGVNMAQGGRIGYRYGKNYKSNQGLDGSERIRDLELMISRDQEVPAEMVGSVAQHIYKIETGVYPEDVQADLNRTKTYIKPNHIVGTNKDNEGNVNQLILDANYDEIYTSGQIYFDPVSGNLFKNVSKTGEKPLFIRTEKAQGGRIGAQEGGLMDLGGMEKDYRQEGGFVPIGGQERADDVPARLSKNEFVFTADAVRSAGGGDIDKGAEVMENVMEHLEQGGQVSEESQGLEGARNMFATAQRLEGVM